MLSFVLKIGIYFILQPLEKVVPNQPLEKVVPNQPLEKVAPNQPLEKVAPNQRKVSSRF
jgi:hypothetical protein